MLVLGVDAGPTHCGVVLFDGERVRWAEKALNVEETLWRMAAAFARIGGPPDLVAIEQIQSYGQSGNSLLRTAEVTGRLWQRALDNGATVELVPRREVLRHLDVLGARGNRDALVRSRLIDAFGGSRQAAVGTKKAPGKLYGLSGHSWQAMAVAYVAWERRRDADNR